MAIMTLHRLSLETRSMPSGELIESRLKYDLTPPYQRASVWSSRERVALMKSLFMGLPIGAVHLNFRGYAQPLIYAVVDGKQRIEALRSFTDDGFAIPADWFELEDILGPCSPIEVDGATVTGVKYSALSRHLQSVILDFPISAIIAKVATVEDEAALFGLINSSGAAQSPEDLARAQAVAAR